jgi:predicted Fe-Mo cluster-binding NifX family protein
VPWTRGGGKAERIGLARIAGSTIVDWQVVEVDWNALHDQGTEGSHHARVVRFLRERAVTDVIAGHMGDSMRNTLGKLGIRIHLGAAGDARAAIASVLIAPASTP